MQMKRKLIYPDISFNCIRNMKKKNTIRRTDWRTKEGTDGLEIITGKKEHILEML